MAPPRAAMTCIIQEALPTGLFGCGSEAFTKSGSASIAVLPAGTVAATAGAGGLIGAAAAVPTKADTTASVDGVSLAAGGAGGLLWAKSYNGALAADAAAALIGAVAGALGGGGLAVLAAKSSSFASSGDRTCTAWPSTMKSPELGCTGAGAACGGRGGAGVRAIACRANRQRRAGGRRFSARHRRRAAEPLLLSYVVVRRVLSPE